MTKERCPRKPIPAGHVAGRLTYTGEWEYREKGEPGAGFFHYKARCACGDHIWIHQGNTYRQKSCVSCRSAKQKDDARARDVSLVGKTVENFTIVSYEGRGSFGVIYRFRDNRCGHECTREVSPSFTSKPYGFKRVCGCPHVYMDAYGYVMWQFGTPSGGRISVREHRIVMEREIGRELREDENVHHVNGDRTDNRPENLELWSTSQPPGQRVEDKTAWAIEWLSRYAPEVLRLPGPSSLIGRMIEEEREPAIVAA